MKTEVTGKVVHGKFIPDTAKSFREAFTAFEDKRVVLTVTKRVKRRSLPQLRYYWGVMVPIFQQGPKGLRPRHERRKGTRLYKGQFLNRARL